MAWSDCLSEELHSSTSQASVCSPSVRIPSMSSSAASTAAVDAPSERRDDIPNQLGHGPYQTTVGPTAYSLPHNVQSPSNNNLVALSNSPKPFLQPPIHGLSAATGPSFSYNFPNAGICLPSGQQLQSSTSSSADVVQETSFPLSSVSQPISSLVHATSSSSLAISPLPKIVTTGFQSSVVSSYHAPQGMPTTPPTPGPPGISSSIPLKSNVNVLPTSIFPSHPSFHQGYASYPSIPSVVAPSHEMWFPSPQGGLPRPPLYPYSAPLPGPFVFQHPGMSLSAPLPDMRPMGNTSMGTSGGIPIPSGAQVAISSVIQQDVPPVTDEKLLSNVSKDGSAISEELNAWTAHRTEAGAVYYYNALTGESTYGKPVGFKGEPEKVTAQTTPVSWEKLSGTDWALVITNDCKKYYYNTKTQLSSWQIPHELTELSRKQASDIVMEESISLPNNSVVTDKESPVSLSTPAIHSGGRDAASLRSSSVSASSALDLIKKKLQDSVVPATSSPVLPLSGSVSSETNGLKAAETAIKGHLSDNNKEKQHGACDEGNISESSSDSEDNESGPTKEECLTQFKEMLKERGVAPFSKWEKELPKIVFDPRFKAIPNYNTRRTLFEHYVRTRAEEERKEKRAAQRAAIDGFKQLLEEAKEDINLNSNYQMFRKKWGNDPRFDALDRKDRESLLNERVLSLRKAAEQKAIAQRAAVSFDFKAMLKEKGDINTTSRWSKVKDDLKDDPRCKSIKREDREILFNEFLSELKAAEEEVSRASKAKYEEHEKLKEREREMRKRKEREEQEVERVRSKARRKEAVESYQALLVETLKDPKASWTESKPKLDKDPQGRSSNPYLDSSDLEKLFREHVKILNERCMNDFKALLSETVTVEAGSRASEDGKTVLNSWSTAKRIMKSDPRYVKAPRKDRESLWQRHVDDIQRRKKSAGPDEEEEKNGAETKGKSLDTGKNTIGRRIPQRS